MPSGGAGEWRGGGWQGLRGMAGFDPVQSAPPSTSTCHLTTRRNRWAQYEQISASCEGGRQRTGRGRGEYPETLY